MPLGRADTSPRRQPRLIVRRTLPQATRIAMCEPSFVGNCVKKLLSTRQFVQTLLNHSQTSNVGTADGKPLPAACADRATQTLGHPL